jgi:hypothetical protein
LLGAAPPGATLAEHGGAAAVAGRSPVGVRLALRDLARHQARSGSALAAISLGLAIVIAIVIAATAGLLLALGRVPVAHLAVIVVGLPLPAAAVGWRLAGREPSTWPASH